jgi:hypothetical protein
MKDCKTFTGGGPRQPAHENRNHLGPGKGIHPGLLATRTEEGSWGSVQAFISDPTKYFIRLNHLFPPFSSTASTIFPAGSSSSKESMVRENPRN